MLILDFLRARHYEDPTSTHHLLRYHAANPRRALALWWNRRRGLP